MSEETQQPASAPASTEAAEAKDQENPKEIQSGKDSEEMPQVESEAEAEAVDEDTDSTDDDDDADDDDDDIDDTDDSADATNAKDDPIDLIARAVSHKDEGNNLFKAGNLTKASRSYRKGTTLLKNLNQNNTGDDQVKSLLVSLQTNLSMVCFKQSKYQQSKEVATKVLSVEATNVKALYRRAVACRKMGDVDGARKDLKLALVHDPTNRTVKKELLAIKAQLEKQKLEKKSKKANLAKAFSGKGSSFLYDDKEELEKRKAQERAVKKVLEEKAREKRKIDWEDECVKRMSVGDDAITFEQYEKDCKKKEEEEHKAKKKAKEEEESRKNAERMAKKEAARRKREENQSTANDDDDDDELTEKEMQMLRGYKKTSDGRTTSYFTREQTEEEKKLLGNIAPQRLDVSPSNAPPQRLESTTSVNSVNSKSSSAWNQAGTWEEKDTSEWCNASLRSYLKEALVEMDSHYTAKVSEVKELTGDASVAFVSGKKRYVFDYNATLKYNIFDEGDEKVASGSLKLPDISSTAISDELEIDVYAWKTAPEEGKADMAIKCRDALVNQIRSQVLAFVGAFNAQY